jgi:bisphosphoglycerate-independent phosphoglycerate mutase (AlkP superfamily)
MADWPNVPRRPVLLVILDGFGVNPAKANNAVALARTPQLDHYFALQPPYQPPGLGPGGGPT